MISVLIAARRWENSDVVTRSPVSAGGTAVAVALTGCFSNLGDYQR
ncbi:MAG: hypothetical protein HC785_26390 [Calothrix sp. CSU_2_0]|nr:hypothetical protein [Calothrix sp. CSU_2_0]